MSEGFSISELRKERIQELRVSSLEKLDPLRALVGDSNAGLMEIAGDIRERIVAVLDENPTGLPALKEVMEALNVNLRLERQIELYAQFELRIAEAQAKHQKALGISLDPLRSAKGMRRNYK